MAKKIKLGKSVPYKKQVTTSKLFEMGMKLCCECGYMMGSEEEMCTKCSSFNRPSVRKIVASKL